MDEHLTPEEQLKQLIAQGNLMIANGNILLTKLKKTLNGFIYVGVPTIAIFLGSYWYNNNRMTVLENTRMTNEKLEEKFAAKSDVLFLQNNIFDMNCAAFMLQGGVTQSYLEKQYNKALKQFTGDITRSATK